MSHAMDAVGRACCYTYVLSDCGSTRTDVEFSLSTQAVLRRSVSRLARRCESHAIVAAGRDLSQRCANTFVKAASRVAASPRRAASIQRFMCSIVEYSALWHSTTEGPHLLCAHTPQAQRLSAQRVQSQIPERRRA